MREKSNGDFTGHDSIFHIAATAKQRRQRRRWGRRLVDIRLLGLTMRLRDDNHRSRLAWTRRRQRTGRLLYGTRGGRTGDDGLVVVMMMVMMMAADGGER